MATSTIPFSYGDLIKRAYRIVRNHKVLWIFGFFASFLGIGGELEPLIRIVFNLADTSEGFFSLQSLYQQGVIGTLLENVVNTFTAYPLQSMIYLFLIAVVAVLAYWIAITSQIALFDSTDKITGAKPFTFNSAFHAGHRRFWPVLLINVILKGVIYALFIVIGSVLVSWFLVRSSVFGGVIFIILAFLVMTPALIAVSFVVRYAIAYMVLQGKEAAESVKLGWQLFKRHWLISIEMAFIVLGLGLLAGIGIIILLGLASVPFVLLGIAALYFGAASAFGIIIVVGTITWIIIAAIVGGIFVAFSYVAWTLLFQQLVERQAHSKVLRFLGKFIPGAATKLSR